MPAPLRRAIFAWAAHEWIVAIYLAVLCVIAVRVGGDRTVGLIFVGFCVLTTSLRAGALRGPMAGAAHRLLVFGAVQSSYFLLRDLLERVGDSRDTALCAADVRLFGVEPTMLFDRFVSPSLTEWFSFAYLTYFGILAVHVFFVLGACRDDRVIAEFGLAIAITICATHVLYFLVPAVGPFRHLASSFANPLEGRLHRFLVEFVASSGAQRDVFPSLHTAAPTMLAIFGFRHRRLIVFRLGWPVVAFASINIVVSTIYLRWHYAIDVIAGLLLAVVAIVLATKIAAWERDRRAVLGVGPAWPPLWGEREETWPTG